jgi:hypothetical protein
MWNGILKTKKILEWIHCASMGLTPTCPHYCKNPWLMYAKWPQPLYVAPRKKPTNKNPIMFHNQVEALGSERLGRLFNHILKFFDRMNVCVWLRLFVPRG